MSQETYEGMRGELNQLERRVDQIERTTMTADGLRAAILENQHAASEAIRLNLANGLAAHEKRFAELQDAQGKRMEKVFDDLREELRDSVKTLTVRMDQMPTTDSVKLAIQDTLKDNKRFSVAQILNTLLVLATLGVVIVDYMKH